MPLTPERVLTDGTAKTRLLLEIPALIAPEALTDNEAAMFADVVVPACVLPAANNVIAAGTAVAPDMIKMLFDE